MCLFLGVIPFLIPREPASKSARQTGLAIVCWYPSMVFVKFPFWFSPNTTKQPGTLKNRPACMAGFFFVGVPCGVLLTSHHSDARSPALSAGQGVGGYPDSRGRSRVRQGAGAEGWRPRPRLGGRGGFFRAEARRKFFGRCGEVFGRDFVYIYICMYISTICTWFFVSLSLSLSLFFSLSLSLSLSFSPLFFSIFFCLFLALCVSWDCLYL